MKKTSFQFPIFPLLLLLCFVFSCKQQEEKVANEKNVVDDLQLDKIPLVVMDALKTKFHKAEIHKWTKENEDEMVIYDIEFKQEERKFEADITEDGTIHNWEKAIENKELPEAVKKSVENKYANANFKEIMEITAVKDGKDALEGYEIVLDTSDKKEIEVTVAPDGRILEEGDEKQ
jgi:hypothetical protein